MGDLYIAMELDGGSRRAFFTHTGMTGVCACLWGIFYLLFLRPSSGSSGSSREADLVEPIYRHSSHGLN